MSAEPDSSDALYAGKYRLLRLLGKGAMGEVWLAEEEGPRNFRRRVAVKKLAARPDLGDYAPESFFAEAQVIARIDHPNVVRLIELGIADGAVYLVLDFVDGPALDRLLKKGGGPFSPRAVAYIGREIARALEAVHSLCDEDGKNYGVVHRDISPSNILVARDGRVRLTDFGVARISGLGGEKTETGVFKGKLPYMPPEQARGDPFDGRADVFSLGVTLFEALLGKRVRKAETQTQLIMKVASSPVPRVQELVPTAPAALADAINAALEFDANNRTPDAGKFAEDLEHALWSLGPTAEFEARGELRQRVEVVTGLPEPITGRHLRQSTPSRAMNRSVSSIPPRTHPPQISAVSKIKDEETKPDTSSSAGRPLGWVAPITTDAGDAPPSVPTVALPGRATPDNQISSSSTLGQTSSITQPTPTPAVSDLQTPPQKPLNRLVLISAAVLGFALATILLWQFQRGKPQPQSGDPESITTSIALSETTPTPSIPTSSIPIVEAPTATVEASTDPVQPDEPETGKPSAPKGTVSPKPRTGTLPAPTQTAAEEADSTAPGTLTVVVSPWADVTVDGRSVGTTPLPPISLSPGPHTVVLRNSELGAVQTRGVVIKPGKPNLLRVDLRRAE